MVRRIVIIVSVVLVLAGAWAAMPVLAAWQIREAVRTGDTRTLAAKVDWTSVRHSLKSSLAETRQALAELTQTAGEPQPSLWQRLKVAALPYLTDPLIERYVTAEGAPRLYAWRQTWRKRLGATVAPAPVKGPLAGTWLGGSSADRNLAALRRIDRAAFVSPTRLEIVLADSYRVERSWFAALELRGASWHLVEMKVLARPAPRDGAAAARTATSQ